MPWWKTPQVCFRLQLGKPPFGFLTLDFNSGVETAPVWGAGFLSSSPAHHLVEGRDKKRPV